MTKMRICGYFPTVVLFAVTLCLKWTPTIAECDASQRETIYTCRDALSAVLRQRLSSDYGIQDLTVADVTGDDDELKEKSGKVTKRVICSPANSATVDCLFDNLAECPDVRQEANFTSIPIGLLFNGQWDTLTNYTLHCDGISKVLCDNVMDAKFMDCFDDLYKDGILQDITSSDICEYGAPSAIDCVIDVMKEECVSFLSNANLPMDLKNLLITDKWSHFTDSANLCNCYEARGCWSNLEPALTEVRETTDFSTTTGKYKGDLKRGQTVCRNNNLLDCVGPHANLCQGFDSIRTNSEFINSLYQAESEICPVFLSAAYTNNKECILAQLANEFHPCIANLRLTSTIVKCRDLEALYKCMQLALSGECNGDFVDAMFELLRNDMHQIRNCDPKSGASPVVAKMAAPSLLVVLIGYMLAR